ncbi:substrate-binding domain-containing protein [Paenibacillus mendelii]|uniref:Substrate-binding domain-containing protein n=1 Tax=Paenibacillus mendelii TaxID=206163 RepID=A0ABV6JEM5_9BACL|nr:substrate-binding domain-containing protein [Paenibacillus mendelii]MCQ6562950.1 substrate-binding domain-containing protein [Paenibacillus mendelii]
MLRERRSEQVRIDNNFKAIEDRGIRIPDELSVLSFDDDDTFLLHKPTINTVRQPLYELGVEAARILLAHIAAGTKPVQTHIHMLKTSFIERNSIAPASAPK